MIIYELNARVYNKKFSEITDTELKHLASLGFDWLWLMGIWQLSVAGRDIARRRAEDFEASPYAITEYLLNPELGDEDSFRDLVNRAHAAGLRVMADFVPNHMAVDSPLIDQHPEYFIHSNPDIRKEQDRDFFTHTSGLRLAHGRDPYFAGWPDTAQLDYLHPGLRTHQINVLKRLAGMVDGLRCDMAMLILREQIKNQWFTSIDWYTFNNHFPNEFWPEAIANVKAIRPDFVFMAEVYWDKESYLQHLGFDLTYDKKLYDLISHNSSPYDIANYLQSASYQYLSHSVHFLENHDEERATTRFGARAHPAAVLSFAILGVPFVHQGQMQGLREKLPVERVRPLQRESPDYQLEQFYKRLLAIVRDNIFRVGEMLVLSPQSGIVLIRRRYEGRTVLIGVDTSVAPGSVNPAIEISRDNLGLLSNGHPYAIDLWNSKPVDLNHNGNNLIVPVGTLKSWCELGAFLLEISTQ